MLVDELETSTLPVSPSNSTSSCFQLSNGNPLGQPPMKRQVMESSMGAISSAPGGFQTGQSQSIVSHAGANPLAALYPYPGLIPQAASLQANTAYYQQGERIVQCCRRRRAVPSTSCLCRSPTLVCIQSLAAMLSHTTTGQHEHAHSHQHAHTCVLLDRGNINTHTHTHTHK